MPPTNNWVYYAEQNGQPSLYEYANSGWLTLDPIGDNQAFSLMA